MSGLLSSFELPPAERAVRFAQMEQQWKAKADETERCMQRRGEMVAWLELCLGEHLYAEMVEGERSLVSASAYRNDVQRFKAWCAAEGVQSLPAPPEAVATWLIETAGTAKKIPSPRRMSRMVAAIDLLHRLSGFESPTDDVLVKAGLRYVRAQRHAAAHPTTDLQQTKH
jgi:hypothetical protein